MIKLLKNKRLIVTLAILGSLICVASNASDPGSSSDPLISLSYFEDKIEDLKTTLLDDLTKNFSGFTAGFGLRISSFRLEYAHAQYHSSSNTDHFGLIIDLENFLQPRYY